MIVEFALFFSLAEPQGAMITPVEFNEPVLHVVTYPPEGVVNQITGLPLPEGTREVYEYEFIQDTKFFGAFAITKDFGYGYVTGTNSIEAARDIALEECYKQAPECLIYAEILPRGFQPLDEGHVSLAQEAANRYKNPDPGWGDFRAMAISEDGAYSVVWNYGSPRAAADAALSDCAEFKITNLPNLRDMPCITLPFK